MAETATITIRSNEPPAQGKKKNKITDMGGDFYYVWPDKASSYVVGETVDITFTTLTFNGAKIRNIESGRRSQAAPQQARAAYSGPGSTGGGTNTYRETSDKDRLSMFVTAIVKAGVQSGQVQFNDEAIAIAIQQAIAGFREGWSGAAQATTTTGPAGPAPRRELNDEIPFSPERR